MNDAVTAWLQKPLHLKSLARAQHHPHYNHLAGFVTAQLASGRLNYPTFCCQTSPPGRQSSPHTPTPLGCRIRNPRTARQAQQDTPRGCRALRNLAQGAAPVSFSSREDHGAAASAGLHPTGFVPFRSCYLLHKEPGAAWCHPRAALSAAGTRHHGVTSTDLLGSSGGRARSGTTTAVPGLLLFGTQPLSPLVSHQQESFPQPLGSLNPYLDEPEIRHFSLPVFKHLALKPGSHVSCL